MSNSHRADHLGRAYKGSQLQIQTYVNVLTEDLNGVIRSAYPLGDFQWVSPLPRDKYLEYDDRTFLEALSLSQHGGVLEAFWPIGGPTWDALAVSDQSVILLEAKSWPGEANSTSRGSDPASIALIRHSLRRAAEWLGISTLPETWWKGYYQTANRLAHLFFLRELCGVDAYLIYLNFTDDPTHNATSLANWSRATATQLDALEISNLPPSAKMLNLPGVSREVLVPQPA